MADIYVRSTDGNNADNGSTWALAKADLTGAAAIDAAGDNIYVSQVHAESTAAAITIALAGTVANPVKVVCVNDAAEPPTAVATTGTVSTTGNSSISINGSAYVYGLTFQTSVGGGNNGSAGFSLNSTGAGFLTYKDCTFKILSTSTNVAFNLYPGNTSASGVTRLFGCNFRTGRTDNQPISGGGGDILISGGSYQAESGSYVGSVFSPFGSSGEGGWRFTVEGFDLSGCGAGVNIVNSPNVAATCNSQRFIIRNSKLPASWSGSLVAGTWNGIGQRAELYNCDSGDTNYRLWIQDYGGSIFSETTIVRTGGASDGTTPLSWRMVSSANVLFQGFSLDSPEIVQWNETTGSSITATIEILTDNVTLTDAECWIEVQYLGTSGFPLSLFVSDAKVDILATAANQATSTETWTTTGIGAPVKQKLSVTFTPQEKGFIHAVVKLAKASTTVYVDPELTVS